LKLIQNEMCALVKYHCSGLAAVELLGWPGLALWICWPRLNRFEPLAGQSSPFRFVFISIYERKIKTK